MDIPYFGCILVRSNSLIILIFPSITLWKAKINNSKSVTKLHEPNHEFCKISFICQLHDSIRDDDKTKKKEVISMRIKQCMDKTVLDIICKKTAPDKWEFFIQIILCQKNIPFLLIYRIMLQMPSSTKQKSKERINLECVHIFPDIRMNWFWIFNRPKQLLLVSLPCHKVLTHYVLSNTFGMVGFPSESQYLRGWKQNLNTVRSIQICSNLETQWTLQLPRDSHYLRRNKPFSKFLLI